jgi:hypothetical protein
LSGTPHTTCIESENPHCIDLAATNPLSADLQITCGSTRKRLGCIVCDLSAIHHAAPSLWPTGTAPMSPTDTTLVPPEPSVPRYTMPPLVWGQANLRAAAGAPRPWLWRGYLAPGAVTLLTGQWKAGKTTLASVLLARLKTGAELAGLPLAPGRAIVISEESNRPMEPG